MKNLLRGLRSLSGYLIVGPFPILTCGASIERLVGYWKSQIVTPREIWRGAIVDDFSLLLTAQYGKLVMGKSHGGSGTGEAGPLRRAVKFLLGDMLIA
jgi:hypothetical protein